MSNLPPSSPGVEDPPSQGGEEDERPGEGGISNVPRASETAASVGAELGLGCLI